MEVHRAEVYDCFQGPVVFGEALLQDAWLQGRTDNPVAADDVNRRRGFQYYDTSVRTLLSNVTFARFERDDEAALLTMTHSDQFTNQAINCVQDATFVDVAPANRIVQVNMAEHALHSRQANRETGAARRSNIVDFDGSASGWGVPTIIGSHLEWWDAGPGCQRD